MALDQLPSHAQLQSLASQHKALHMRDLFNQDPERSDRFSIQAAGLFLDFSKNRIDENVFKSLLKLCDEADVIAQRTAMFSGEKINNTEGRAVLHTALRSPSDQKVLVDGEDVIPEIHATQKRMAELAQALYSGDLRGATGKKLTTLVSIGIGGSYLGPRLVYEALEPYRKPGLSCHFVANIDSTDLAQVLAQIDYEETLFLIQSKSFKTQETLENALAARNWFFEQGGSQNDVAKHFFAVSSQLELAAEFGIPSQNVLPMWDWVGGRYSLWSAIGFPIVFAVGPENFQAMLKGARRMDEHFCEAKFDENLPVVLAVLGIWYNNYFDCESHAVLPYIQLLSALPAYLQQLDMESNGKSVDRYGEALVANSGPIIWGDVGANGQHAYHQLMHQGTRPIPTDFIISKSTPYPIKAHHEHLNANCLAQSQALMAGKTLAQAKAELKAAGKSESEVETLAVHKVIPGNKPSNTIILEDLSPESLGTLIALYEHKVFVQGVIWGLNSFDQWGVELGKSLETGIFSAMQGGSQDDLDSSTRNLLAKLKR